MTQPPNIKQKITTYVIAACKVVSFKLLCAQDKLLSSSIIQTVIVIIIFAGTTTQSASTGEIIPTTPVKKIKSIEIGIKGTTNTLAIGEITDNLPKITDI